MKARQNKDVIRKELNALREINGEHLTPLDVVNAAEHVDHPLHDCFDWDDTKAAHSWRLTQARELITSFRYVRTTTTKKIASVFYVRDPDLPSDQPGYLAVTSLIADKARARLVLLAEFARAMALLNRTRELAVVFGLESEIDEIFDLVDLLNDKVSDDAFMLPPEPPKKPRRPRREPPGNRQHPPPPI